MNTSSSTQNQSAIHILAAGLICGFLAVVQSAGFGLLLLSGESEGLVAATIGMALLSSTVMAAIAALTSSIPAVVSISQGIPIAALAGPIGAIIAVTRDDATAATVIAAVATSTVLFGVVAFLIGAFKLGRFIRFVPFPVVGGFLAGSGWLIFVGGMNVVAGETSLLADILAIDDPHVLARFAVAIGFIALAYALRTRLPANLALPGAALLGLIVYNLFVALSEIPAATLTETGWIIGFGEGGLWPPVKFSELAAVDFSALSVLATALPTVVILSVIAVLMNATGLELDLRRDIDLDGELRSVGMQNVLAGIGGGLPGFQSVSLTSLSNRLGAHGRTVGLIVAALCLATLFFGDVILSWFPTPLLGGFLLWIGLALLIEWLVRSYRRLSVGEYAVILLIFAVIAVFGFAWGILVGLIAAAVLFVIEYGQVEIVRHVMTGQDYQSNNASSEERRDMLQKAGGAILIMRLQGFLFFGTADRLRKQIQQRIETDSGHVQFLIVDFRRVSGLDSSTVVSFARLAQLTKPNGFTLVMSGLSSTVREAFDRGGLGTDEETLVHFEDQFDDGLQWCEDHVLQNVAPDVMEGEALPVADLLARIVQDLDLAQDLVPYLERVIFDPGETIIKQGSPPGDILFIEDGQAFVELEVNGQPNVRVATVTRGSIVGEIAFYLNKPRTASVIADEMVIAWRFSSGDLDRLRTASPELAIAFHRGMASLLADRLSSTNQLLKLLSD